MTRTTEARFSRDKSQVPALLVILLLILALSLLETTTTSTTTKRSFRSVGFGVDAFAFAFPFASTHRNILSRPYFTPATDTFLRANAAERSSSSPSSAPSPRHKTSSISPSTHCLTSKSGLPVCRYALGGAARSTQPKSLVKEYYNDIIKGFEGTHAEKTTTAPFYFYYNPHRYPDFMQGIYKLVNHDENNENNNANTNDNHGDRIQRDDIFLASGGTDRSDRGMEQRLLDALRYSGEEYLDMFVLEYVCPEEVDDPDLFLGALETARSWVRDGKVRYVAASTHSHKVGAWLGSLRPNDIDIDVDVDNNNNNNDNNAPLLDAMMLRYNMGHKTAAEHYSFPVCAEAGIPVMAFTTTRWNKLQAGHPDWQEQKVPPNTPECLSFALSPSSPSWSSPATTTIKRTTTQTAKWPVEIVLHSARTIEELREAISCLSSPAAVSASLNVGSSSALWREYGDLNWNDIDGFDEYPEEQQ